MSNEVVGWKDVELGRSQSAEREKVETKEQREDKEKENRKSEIGVRQREHPGRSIV